MSHKQLSGTALRPEPARRSDGTNQEIRGGARMNSARERAAKAQSMRVCSAEDAETTPAAEDSGQRSRLFGEMFQLSLADKGPADVRIP